MGAGAVANPPFEVADPPVNPPPPQSFDVRQSSAVPTDELKDTMELADEVLLAFGGRALKDRGG